MRGELVDQILTLWTSMLAPVSLHRLNIPRSLHMNTNDLVDAVATATGATRADARKLVDSVFGSIAEAANRNEEIAINGFGKFKVKASPARDGRNPSTGETIKIKASKKLTFAAAKAIKDKLNG